jgi:hypothetical protein
VRVLHLFGGSTWGSPPFINVTSELRLLRENELKRLSLYYYGAGGRLKP